MIGQSEDGRYWTIAIKPTDELGVWQVITGFEAGEKQVDMYHKWVGRSLIGKK